MLAYNMLLGVIPVALLGLFIAGQVLSSTAVQHSVLTDLQEVFPGAAEAAGLPVDRCLAAAADARLDGPIHATARGLAARGVRSLPAIRIGRNLLWGEQMLDEALLLLRATAVT